MPRLRRPWLDDETMRQPQRGWVGMVAVDRSLGLVILHEHQCEREAHAGRRHMPLDQQRRQHAGMARGKLAHDDLVPRLFAREAVVADQMRDLIVPRLAHAEFAGPKAVADLAIASPNVLSVSFAHVHPPPCAPALSLNERNLWPSRVARKVSPRLTASSLPPYPAAEIGTAWARITCRKDLHS